MNDAVLEVHNLTKAYGENVVLSDVSLSLRSGEVLGLIGENGAGKSTLLNIMSGTTSATSGQMTVGSAEYRPRSYREAASRGVFRVFQELALVGTMTVYENLFLAHEDKFPGFGPQRMRRMRSQAIDLLAEYSHGHVSPTSLIADLNFPTRQILEVIKSVGLAQLLGITQPVILLDEPTTALSQEESEFFGQFIRGIREQTAIVFVSHRLEELTALSDRMMILKDGRVVAETPQFEPSPNVIHSLMVGRERNESFYREDKQPLTVDSEVVLEARNVGMIDGTFSDISLQLHSGEILGLGGVLGSGKSEVAKALYGVGGGPERGEVFVGGDVVPRMSVAAMMRLGFGYVPPERGEVGTLPDHSLAWNISLPRQGPGDLDKTPLNLRAERARAEEMIKQLRIKATGPEQVIRELSGGNQQKAIFARWLARPTRILILDNPTRGVDAGSKAEIYEVLRTLTSDGVSVLLATDDLLELIGLSDRILLMKDGQITYECSAKPGEKPEEAELVARMM